MKPLPAPHIPGKTDFQRFDNAVRQVLTVSEGRTPQTDTARAEREREKATEEVALLAFVRILLLAGALKLGSDGLEFSRRLL